MTDRDLTKRDPLGRSTEPQWKIKVETYRHANGRVRYSPVRVRGREGYRGDREELTKLSGWQENSHDIYSRKYYRTERGARRAGEKRRLRGEAEWTRVD